MPYANAKGHQIHYELRGPEGAPPVLLIMGLGLASSAFDVLPERLAERFRVITFDNRGTGQSSRSMRLFRVNDMADDAACVLAAAGVPRAHVFGISMGGMIAIELALRHPERVDHLALGCTFAGWLRSKHPPPSVLGNLLKGVALGRKTALRGLARMLVSDAFAEMEFERFMSWLARGQVRRRSTVLQLAAIARHTTEARLAKLTAPTLVITGDADRLIPPENSRRLARWIPNARLHLVPGAGHCFPFERPDETVEALTRFFAGDVEQAASASAA